MGPGGRCARVELAAPVVRVSGSEMADHGEVCDVCDDPVAHLGMAGVREMAMVRASGAAVAAVTAGAARAVAMQHGAFAHAGRHLWRRRQRRRQRAHVGVPASHTQPPGWW